MPTLKNHRKVESGKIFDAYFNAEHFQTQIEKKRPFGLRGGWEETVTAFNFNGKTYAVTGYDHFNGHFSGFTDRAAIFGIYIAEIVN